MLLFNTQQEKYINLPIDIIKVKKVTVTILFIHKFECPK